MKLLPCAGSKECEKKGARWPPSSAYPNGEPGVSGQYVSRYKCHRCKLTSELTRSRWNSLPELTLEGFAQLALTVKAPAFADLPLRDFTANGLSREQAEQTFRAGFLDTLQAESFHERIVALVEAASWHSEGSDVYHDQWRCQTGDNINPRYLQAGKAGRRRCSECAKLSGERRRPRK